MGALLIALLPALSALSGVATTTVFAGLTLAEWAAITGAVANLATNSTVDAAVKSEIEKVLTDLHPIFAKLVADVAKVGSQTAAENAFAFNFENPANPGVIN
jgi:hypothetical protein